MKPVLTALIALTASPAFAHVGTHMHPHATDASWLPVLLGGLALAAAATLALGRRR